VTEDDFFHIVDLDGAGQPAGWRPVRDRLLRGHRWPVPKVSASYRCHGVHHEPGPHIPRLACQGRWVTYPGVNEKAGPSGSFLASSLR
jgi:hypothetical protein